MSDVLALDSSAILAIVMEEAESERFTSIAVSSRKILLSRVTFVETAIVLENKFGAGGSKLLEEFLKDFRVELVDLDAAQSNAALMAYWRFGRGLHSARLNFGDCFSYALAKVRGMPLLFKGGDFDKMDVVEPEWDNP